MYTITDLGVSDEASASALGINDAGQVAGEFMPIPGDTVHAFRWDPSRELVDLAGDASGDAINTSGQVVGSLGDGNSVRAAIWTDAAVDVFGPPQSEGYGLNDAGQIVGVFEVSQGIVHAFVRRSAAQFVDLGIGTKWSAAYAINNAGAIVSMAKLADGQDHAFYWTPDGQAQDLTPPGSSSSWARSINNFGQVVGTTFGNTGSKPFLWTAAGGMQDLDPAYSNESSLTPWFINDQGDVVGALTAGDGSSRAFVFTGGQTLDLNNAISADSGWTLQQATGINASGSIVGWGLVGNITRAFLLTPQPVRRSPPPPPGGDICARLYAQLLELEGDLARQEATLRSQGRNPNDDPSIRAINLYTSRLVNEMREIGCSIPILHKPVGS